MRRLTLYFEIIAIIVFGVGYIYGNMPCSPCLIDNDDAIYNTNKQYCDGCIPNYNNYGYSFLNYFSKTLKKKSVRNEPCTDFYELICGTWDKANSLFHSKWSIKNYNEYMTYYNIKLFLENTTYNDFPFIKTVKQLYRSCMDQDSLEERGVNPMQQMLDATGGWPIIMSEEEWNAKNYTWQKIDNNYFKLYTFSILFNISYSTDYDNLGIFMIYPSLLSFGDKLKFDKQYIYEHYNMYLNTIMKVARTFAKNKGIRIPTKKLRNDVEDLIAFELFFKNIIGHKKEIIGSGNKMTIAELQEYYDLAGAQHATAKINWLEKIQIASKLLGTTIDASETVLVFNKDILHKLAHLLSDTPQHVIVNYLQWRAVSMFIGNLNKQMRDIELDLYYAYNIKLHDKIKQEQRWLKCIREFEMKNIFISSFIYSSETCSETSYIEMLTVHGIFHDIKNEMIDYIKSLLWLNNLTKNFMVEKINNITLNLGFSECYRNPTVLAQMYKELKIDDNYFTNILSIIKYRNTIIKQRSFRESAHRNKSSYGWSYDFLSDNISYNQQSNEIYIPITLMQFPYFSSDESLAAIYGGVGSVIGQQLAHIANLYIGSYFDNHGNIKYDIGVGQALERRSECLLKLIMNNIKQYHNVSPNVTIKNLEYIQLYENLAKNRAHITTQFIGTQIAFTALEKQSSLPMLSNSILTSELAADICCQSKDFQKAIVNPERMFFFYNTMVTCGSTLPYNEDFINISITKAQINSYLANIKGFSEAFNCPVDSPMNSKLKCKIWDKATN